MGLLPNLKRGQPTRKASLPAFPSPDGGHAQLELKIELKDDRDQFVAGERIEGWLKIDVKADDGVLALGDLRIILGGHETLRIQSHSSTSPFPTQQRDFQGPGFAPSCATVPHAAPLNGHFFPALRGKTAFPFHFTLPKTAASSVALGGAASRAYELVAFASTLDRGGGERHSQERRAVGVLERWEDWQGQEDGWAGLGEAKRAARVERAGNGVVELGCEVGREEDGPARLFWRANKERATEGKTRIHVVARVRNNSTKPAQGIKLQLVRQLRPLKRVGQDGQDDEPTPALLTIPLGAKSFTGDEFDFAPGQKKQVSLAIDLPDDEGWNTRKGGLFRLDCAVLVELHGPAMDRPVVVELPVWIAHPRSLPPAAHHHVAKRLAKLRAELPAMLSEQDSYLHQPHQLHRAGSAVSLAGPPSAGSHSPLPFGHHSPASSMHLPSGPSGHLGYAPVTPPPPQTFVSQQTLHQQHFGAPPGPVPSPSVGQLYQAGPPPADPMAFYNQHVQQLAPQQAYPANFLPAPPASHPMAGGSTVSSSHSARSGFQYYSAGTPYHAPPPPSVPGSNYHSSGEFSRQPSPSQQSYVSSVPSHSPAPSVYGVGLPSQQAPVAQQHQPPQHYYGALPAEHQWHQSQAQQYAQQYAQPQVPPHQPERGYQPGELFAAVLARPDVPEQTRPQPQPQSQHLQQPSPPRMTRSGSVGSHRSGQSTHRTTPPASPSAGAARYRAPSPARAIPLPRQHSLAQQQIEEAQAYSGLEPTAAELALETIGEDGESQAGTARSVAQGVVQALAAPGGVQAADELRNGPVSNRRSSVQDLEEMVRQEEEEKEVRARLEDRRRDKEKSVPKAMDIFAAHAEAPSSPASVSASPPKSPAPSLIPREAGGLSALEARLLNPASPSLPFPSSPTQPPPPRALSSSPSSVAGLRASPSTSALRQRSLSRASSERALAERLAREDPREAVRRALEGAGGARSRPGSPLKPSVGQGAVEPELGQDVQGAEVHAAPEEEAEEEEETRAFEPGRIMSAQVEGALAAPQGEGAVRSGSVQSLLAAVYAESEEAEKVRRERGEDCEPELPRDGETQESVAEPVRPAGRRWEDETLEGTTAWEEQLPASASSMRLFEQAEEAVEEVQGVSTPGTELAYCAFEAPSPPIEPVKVEVEEEAVPETQAVKRPPLPKLPATEPAVADPPLAVAAPTLVDGRKVVDGQEQRDLRKEAAARMAQWIRTGASPTKAPSMSSPWTTGGAGSAQAKRVFARVAPAPPPVEVEEREGAAAVVVKRETVVASPPGSPARQRFQSSPSRAGLALQAHAHEPTVAQLLAAESRAALRAHSDENHATAVAPSTPPSTRPGPAAEAYDIRSARGGKGGAVAHVGSQWKRMIEEEERKRREEEGKEEEVRREVAAGLKAKRASAPAGRWGEAERGMLRRLNLGEEENGKRQGRGAGDEVAGKRFSVSWARPVGAGGGGIAALRAQWEAQRG